MEISDYNINDLLNDKKNLGDFLKNYDSIKNNLKKDEIKISLLNVDSKYRNKEPKNIYDSNNIYLKNNPIYTRKGDNQIKINFPSHNFKVGDLITISNVESINKTFSNSFFLFNGLTHLIIRLPNHQIPKDYKNYTDEIKVDINLLSTISSNENLNTRFYGSIPINTLIGIKKIITYDDLRNRFENIETNQLTLLKEKIMENFQNIKNDDDIYNNFLFIDLEFIFISNSTNLYPIQHTYSLKFISLNGIKLSNINSDYPINYERRQGNQEIVNIDEDNFWIRCNSKAYGSSYSGGSKVTISKVIRTISGYPNAGEFVMNLRKNFTNIVRVELVSTEFPFTDFVIKEGVNNKLYWQYLDDGDKIYSISIPSGNYTSSSLINTITSKTNSLERIVSTTANKVFNNFTISINTFTNSLQFKAFSEKLLPNSISTGTVVINNKEYFTLEIKDENNFVEEGDEITIFNSESIGLIPKSQINGKHIVYEKSKSGDSYTVLLKPFLVLDVPNEGKGGVSVVVKALSRARFLFNYPDTLGTILGFKDVGNKFSITNFNSVINNYDEYAYPNDLDTVGNKNTVNNVFQLSGKDNYWLLYLNNFESVILSNGLDSSFAKVLLPATQGDVIYNSFVNSPVEFDIPIPTISDLTVKVTDSNGNMVDFENTNFSFTIRIYELLSKPKGTGKFSNETSFVKELLEKLEKNKLQKNV